MTIFSFLNSKYQVEATLKVKNGHISAINKKSKGTLLSSTLKVQERNGSYFFDLWPRG